MNTENQTKYPSIRNNIGFQDKRQSILSPTSSDLKPLTSSIKDISKQVHNRLKLRKRTSNKTQNIIKQNILGRFQTNIQIVDPTKQLKQRIEKEWKNNPKIIESSIKKVRFDEIQNIKAQIQKDISFMLCQVNKGQDLQEILIRKIQRIIKSKTIIQKCQQKQNLLIKMLNDRINKLSIDK